MKRQLSSKQTFVLKIILPIIIGIVFIQMLVLIAVNFRTGGILPLLIVPVLLSVGFLCDVSHNDALQKSFG